MPDAEVDKVSADISVTSPQKGEQVEAAGPNQKQRSVSFNRDVHVKRIAPNRVAPAAPAVDLVRRQPLAGLSRQELAKEAAKVLAQASAVRCSSTTPPDKFFSLPTRRRHRPDPSLSNPPIRRRSEELGITTDLPSKNLKTSLNRSTSDVTSKKHRRNTNTIFNIFKKPEENPAKDSTLVKRSKSDVSDLKSSSIKPIRKRTGSESEEYLNSVIGKKSQLSPIIEIHPSEDYFKNVKSETVTNSEVSEYKVNPIEKPPRTIEPKPPARPKRIKTLTDKNDNFHKPVRAAIKHFDTLPKSRINNQKRILVDETDIKNIRDIKKSIKKTLEDKNTEMIHSSQKPPEKLPLTKGQTVDNMVKILNQDKFTSPPKANLITSPNTAAHNNNQPFSYTRPTSISPDPNLYARSVSPDRAPSPVNRMPQEQNRGVIYAQVVCGDNGRGQKQTVHTSITPERQKLSHNSDEDEGLGYEENRYRNQNEYPYRYSDDYTQDSPITPKFKEFKSHKFIGEELGYEENDNMRGRGDGMDSRRRESLLESEDSKYEKKIAELSHRRELLENRFNARRNRDISISASPENDANKYISESTTVYTTDKNNVTSGYTDKYVVDSRRNKDGTVNRVEERTRSKYNPDTAMFEPVGADELDRREFIDKRLAEEPPEIKYFSQKPSRYFPPEPDYEPPSLDSQNSVSKYSPEIRKYKPKRVYTSSQDGLHSRYSAKHKNEKFGSSRDHYASNPEIVQKSHREEYDPRRPETFHNSLRRQRYNTSDKHYRNQDDYMEQSSSRSLRQQNSDNRYGGETSGPESSKGRYDNDRDRENKFADSGIENDYRKDSNGDIHSRGVVSSSSKDQAKKSDYRNESEDEGFASSLLIASERQHTEDNHHPTKAKYHDLEFRRREEFVHREKSIDDGSFYDPRIDKFEERSQTQHRIEAKPPKVIKKISGLEKVKQLFSRDSSKKSKKEKDKRLDDNSSSSQSRDSRKMSKDDELRRRYTDYRETYDDDHRRTNMSRSSDLEVDSRINAGRYSRSSKTRDDEESSYMDYDYSQRRRMATPTPSPSPPRRTSRNSETLVRKEVSRKPTTTATSGWFKSLDRLSSRNKTKISKNDKDSVLTTTEEESTLSPKRYGSSTAKKAPTKSLRFFGDTDQESNGSVSKNISTLRQRPKISDSRHEPSKYLNRNTKKLSNSAHALDKTEYTESKYKSASLTNLQNGLDSRQNLLINSYNKEKYGNHKRGLHNISEIHSNSETESQFEEREKYQENGDRKPPMSPMREKRRSRSHSGTKLTKSITKNGYHSSRGDLTEDTRPMSEIHSSKPDLRGSRQELTSSRNDLRTRRRRMITGATSPADSSTEGDSSHQSQRSIVYLHAPTVGDIPSTGRISRGRSRDDVSSVNSSLQPHTKTVSRSFSVLAPWKPRLYREGYDINYSQSGHQSTMKRSVKSPPPKKESGFNFGKNKSASTKNLSTTKYERPSEERSIPNKSSTLSRYAKDDKKVASNGTLFRKSEKPRIKENVSSTMSRSKNDLRDKSYKKSMSTEVLSRDSPPKGTKRSSVERERISRSISMPKDPNKTAGWFKISKKSKKIENSSRVY